MPRQILSLGGDDWRLGQAPADADPKHASLQEIPRIIEWCQARVPGNVRADLMRSGRLPDLGFGLNSRAADWPDEHCWWFVKDFDVPRYPPARQFIILRGVDYVWDLFLNDVHLGRHEGMFSPRRLEITGILKERNRLAVRITGSRWLPRDRSNPWEKVLNRIEATLSGLPGTYPDRRDTLKCQMSFGWDFAPGLRTMGIWDDLYLHLAGEAVIREVVTSQETQPGATLLRVRVQIDGTAGERTSLRCRVAGETFVSEPISAEMPIRPSGYSGWYELCLTVSDPRLWWTWDTGRPDLYRLTVELLDEGRILDHSVHHIGLREIALSDWTLRVNGHRLFARGANWVPADVLPGRTRRADYEALLTQARQANMNMLRVWGGGLREKRDFYELCDRLGILVWQDLPFACAVMTRFPRSSTYLDLVDAETRAIVRDLREHPCLSLWCGGNEYSPGRNRHLVSTVRQAVTEEDPSRPFLPASPSPGDSHDWRVWHQFEPPSVYRKNRARFVSEFGLQACPRTESLRQFIPDEDLWPPGRSWEHHGADMSKLRRYARPFLREDSCTLEGFVDASQRAQSYGLQVALDHFRRQKAYGCGGALLWQLNEPWPSISWSVIGFDRQPKPALETVTRCFRPTVVSIDYQVERAQATQRLEASVWIINDRLEALPDCELEVALLDAHGVPVECAIWGVRVPPDSAKPFHRISWQLPPGGGWSLWCRLRREDEVLSERRYDLTIQDTTQPKLSHRLRAWLTGLLTELHEH